MDKALNILVLEDEQGAGEKLIDMIRSFAPHAKLEWKRSILEGRLFIQEQPELDLIYSDIELLDGNVFSLFEEIKPSCPLIFCTAYNQYFLDAFRTNGIAYLLKPYTREQFEESWNKYRQLFGQKVEKVDFQHSLEQLKASLGRQKHSYKSTFTVKKKEGVFILPVKEVLFFQSQGDFVVAIDHIGKIHILNYTLQKLEEMLDPRDFFRINRSEILPFTSIQHFSPYTKNRLAINLRNSSEILYTSNSRSPKFREWVEDH
ncbi:MAG: LytTR family DNA-binding domain-containing protein [Bacteroidota bacterium]